MPSTLRLIQVMVSRSSTLQGMLGGRVGGGPVVKGSVWPIRGEYWCHVTGCRVLIGPHLAHRLADDAERGGAVAVGPLVPGALPGHHAVSAGVDAALLVVLQQPIRGEH